MTSFNKYNEDSIRFRAVVNLAAEKEDDSSNERDKPAPKEVAEKKGSKLDRSNRGEIFR